MEIITTEESLIYSVNYVIITIITIANGSLNGYLQNFVKQISVFVEFVIVFIVIVIIYYSGLKLH